MRNLADKRLAALPVLSKVVSDSPFARRGAAWSLSLLLLLLLLLLLGLFFLLSLVAGMLLGAAPAINCGDAAKYEFNLKPFWMVALVVLVSGLFLRVYAVLSRSAG